MNTLVIILLSLAFVFALLGFLIIRGAIKLPPEKADKKDQYAKISFGTALVLAAATILAFFSPTIREKLRERKEAKECADD